MLNSLPAVILLDFAILLTAFSWGLGFYLVDKRVHLSLPSPLVVLSASSVTVSKAWELPLGQS